MQQTHPFNMPLHQSDPSQVTPVGVDARPVSLSGHHGTWLLWLPRWMAHHREGEVCNPGAGEVEIGPYALNPEEAKATIASRHFTVPSSSCPLSGPTPEVSYFPGADRLRPGTWLPEPLSFSSHHGLVHTKEVNQCYTSVSLKFMELFGSKTKKNKTD